MNRLVVTHHHLGQRQPDEFAIDGRAAELCLGLQDGFAFGRLTPGVGRTPAKYLVQAQRDGRIGQAVDRGGVQPMRFHRRFVETVRRGVPRRRARLGSRFAGGQLPAIVNLRP